MILDKHVPQKVHTKRGPETCAARDGAILQIENTVVRTRSLRHLAMHIKNQNARRPARTFHERFRVCILLVQVRQHVGILSVIVANPVIVVLSLVPVHLHHMAHFLRDRSLWRINHHFRSNRHRLLCLVWGSATHRCRYRDSDAASSSREHRRRFRHGFQRRTSLYTSKSSSSLHQIAPRNFPETPTRSRGADGCEPGEKESGRKRSGKTRKCKRCKLGRHRQTFDNGDDDDDGSTSFPSGFTLLHFVFHPVFRRVDNSVPNVQPSYKTVGWL